MGNKNKTKSKSQMKFLALFATAVAAIQLTTEVDVERKGKHICLKPKDAKEVFNHIDTNHNGSLNKHELVAALEDLAAHYDHKITKEEWAWIEETATKVAGYDHVMSEVEFRIFANKLMWHFDIGGCAS